LRAGNDLDTIKQSIGGTITARSWEDCQAKNKNRKNIPTHTPSTIDSKDYKGNKHRYEIMCMPTLLSPSAICTPAMRVDFFMLEIEI
jgi:hypothetical protein